MMTFSRGPLVYLVGLLAVSILLCGSLVEGEEMSMEAEDSMMGDGNSLGCDNCGAECKLKCGTRLFRPCCFHFIRKRHHITYHLLKKQQIPQQQLAGQNIGPLDLHLRDALAHYANSFGIDTAGARVRAEAPVESDFYPENE